MPLSEPDTLPLLDGHGVADRLPEMVGLPLCDTVCDSVPVSEPDCDTDSVPDREPVMEGVPLIDSLPVPDAPLLGEPLAE